MRGLTPMVALMLLAPGCGSVADDGAPGTDPDAGPPAIDASPTANPDAEPDIVVNYALLSETGLYQDVAGKLVADDVLEYAPEYRSWLDGSRSRSWLWLPPGRRIDTSDMDAWYFPVGSKVWQQISRLSGDEEVLLETRFTQRTGMAPDAYWQGSFVWRPDDSDATFARDGASNIKGTPHDAPPASHCNACHLGQASHILGFCAIQLSYPAALNLNTLASEGRLTHPPATAAMYPIPGNAIERAALGFLHADCAHCHAAGLGTYLVTGFGARLFTGARTVADTEAYRTGVDQPLLFWSGAGLTHRVVSGEPDDSAVLYRMSTRGGSSQMPPRFTSVPNAAAVDAVRLWIAGL